MLRLLLVMLVQAKLIFVEVLISDIAEHSVLYLSLEAICQASTLHVLVHQARGGPIVAIGNQGQDVPMVIPNGV